MELSKILTDATDMASKLENARQKEAVKNSMLHAKQESLVEK